MVTTAGIVFAVEFKVGSRTGLDPQKMPTLSSDCLPEGRYPERTATDLNMRSLPDALTAVSGIAIAIFSDLIAAGAHEVIAVHESAAVLVFGRRDCGSLETTR